MTFNLKPYIDSTYLKTAEQANLTEIENDKVITQIIEEAILEHYKLVMIRPEKVCIAKELINKANSDVLIGTVIDFPEGNSSLSQKLEEAQKAIHNGADEIDFVINYNAFKNGQIELIKEEVLACTQLAFYHKKILKFIIEVAALTDDKIIRISSLIKNVIMTNFDEKNYHKVFVKSSTGFYKTNEGIPNGATPHTISLMIENAFPLPIKAAGGVRNETEAIEMIKLGVKRIGTSSAKNITTHQITKNTY